MVRWNTMEYDSLVHQASRGIWTKDGGRKMEPMTCFSQQRARQPPAIIQSTMRVLCHCKRGPIVLLTCCLRSLIFRLFSEL